MRKVEGNAHYDPASHHLEGVKGKGKEPPALKEKFNIPADPTSNAMNTERTIRKMTGHRATELKKTDTSGTKFFSGDQKLFGKLAEGIKNTNPRTSR